MRHILPNCIGPIMVNATLAVAAAIIAESTLSFLGFGVQPPAHVVGHHAVRRRGRTSTTSTVLSASTSRASLILLTVLVRELPRRRSARRLRPAVEHALSARDADRTVDPDLDRRRAAGDVAAGDAPLSVRDLTVEFTTDDGVVHAVDDVSFDVLANETLGIVGESGSGKSVTSMAILGLLPKTAKITRRGAVPRARTSLGMTENELQQLRGDEIAMVFQDALAALNPVFTGRRSDRRGDRACTTT